MYDFSELNEPGWYDQFLADHGEYGGEILAISPSLIAAAKSSQIPETGGDYIDPAHIQSPVPVNNTKIYYAADDQSHISTDDFVADVSNAFDPINEAVES